MHIVSNTSSRAHTHACSIVNWLYNDLFVVAVSASLRVCMCVCMYVCVCMCVRRCAQVCAGVCVCVLVLFYARIHVWTITEQQLSIVGCSKIGSRLEPMVLKGGRTMFEPRLSTSGEERCTRSCMIVLKEGICPTTNFRMRKLISILFEFPTSVYLQVHLYVWCLIYIYICIYLTIHKNHYTCL